MRKGLIFIILLAFNLLLIYGINRANVLMFNNNFMIYLNKDDEEIEINEDDVPGKDETPVDTSYNGESIEDIGKKIDKYCNKTPLEGYGEYIAKTSIIKSVNPYLISGIILESTNCKNECSVLFKECNNLSGTEHSFLQLVLSNMIPLIKYGLTLLISGIILESTNCKNECSVLFKECNNLSGMKGSPGCFGGSYKKYNTIDDAISDIVNVISKDYYTTEMQSPYKMYKDYGKNSSWALKVSNYMDAVKRTK